MFPLGTVLLPSAVIPLHIFEPRYRSLVKDCLAGEKEFGVALIERGNEVGGGDSRMEYGCIAQIVEAEEFDDGRWFIAAVGTRRFTVTRWLADDPYPKADIEFVLEPPSPTDDRALVSEADELLNRVMDLRVQLNPRLRKPEQMPVIASDPALASFQLGALAPLGELDQYALLRSQRADERLGLLIGLLRAQAEDLQLQLDLG